MANQSIGIAILGHGVVGSGVIKILAEQHDLLHKRTGLSFNVLHTVVRDPSKHSGTQINFTTDWKAAIDDPNVKIVIELMGGTDTAGSAVERALKLGKPVVTANKSLLAARGPELFKLARQNNTCIAFEASCGGGIPIIQALQQGLVANRIDALLGIVNGTCNVILTRMTQNGWTYAEALQEAQKLGYAEANPAMDVSGRDAAQKLAILAGLAFNVKVTEDDIHVEGISDIQADDIKFADQLGYVIKLLVIAERKGGSGFGVQGSVKNAATKSSPEPRTPNPDPHSSEPDSLSLRVHPTLVHKSDVLAEVGGSFNAISVFGNALGHTLFYGRGAGQMPTASAVVADLVAVALGTIPLAFKQLNVFPDSVAPAKVLPFAELRSRYYLRVTAKDLPGVMADVTRALGNEGISLSAIRQYESSEGQIVPVVITTHLAAEGAMSRAVKAIDALPTIQAPTVCLRVIDQPKEFAS